MAVKKFAYVRKKQYLCSVKEIKEYIKQSIHIRKVMITCLISLIIIGLCMIVLAIFLAFS